MDWQSQLIGNAPPIFIQPHFDDVPLSCGGTAALAARTVGRPTVTTVFAGEVFDELVGDLAAVKHRRWGVADANEVIARRRAEDTAACEVLDCATRWLGIPDAIYRDRYPTDAQLYGTIAPEEDALVAHLAEEISHLPECTGRTAVFVPLGIGSHVDHQIAFEAGRALARKGMTVWAYEDSPYCIHSPAAAAARMKTVAGALGAEVAFDITRTLRDRLDAIACYGTQVPVLFRFTTDWRGAVEAHARAVGQGVPCERFWRIKE